MDRKQFDPAARELLDLADQVQRYIDTLQISGINESDVITVLANVCTLRVVRTRGSTFAVKWLRSLAQYAENNARGLEIAATATPPQAN